MAKLGSGLGGPFAREGVADVGGWGGECFFRGEEEVGVGFGGFVIVVVVVGEGTPCRERGLEGGDGGRGAGSEFLEAVAAEGEHY